METKNTETRWFSSIEEIKKANAELGHHWFEPGTLRFFNSRILSGVYGGKYFVTSERYSKDDPRLYTVRKAKPNGAIETVGEFQAYKTSRKAIASARKLAWDEIKEESK